MDSRKQQLQVLHDKSRNSKKKTIENVPLPTDLVEKQKKLD